MWEIDIIDVIWYMALHSTHNMQNYDKSNAEHSFPAWMQMDCSCLFSWILVFPNIELDREVEWSLREAHMRKQADLPSSRRVSLEKVSLQQDMLIIRCCCCCCGNGITCCCLQYVQCSQPVEERYPTWSFPDLHHSLEHTTSASSTTTTAATTTTITTTNTSYQYIPIQGDPPVVT